MSNPDPQDIPSFRNPFVVETPEKLSPQQIVDLFIEKYTRIETIKQRRHTFIWGSRGSGKSMMLRYMEPRCQILKSGGVKEFLNQAEPFIAVYCPCKEGQLNKTELLLLDTYSAVILGEHALNLSIAVRLIDCLRVQFPGDYFNKVAVAAFADRVARLFDRASIAGSLKEATEAVPKTDDPLGWLLELFASEVRRISYFLRSRANLLYGASAAYEGATSGYHDFLLPLMHLVRSLPELNGAPVYVLLDDVDRLTKDQQTVVNTWVANRDQAVLCLKISSQREHYKTLLTRSGGLIEQPHDFTEIDVEELYTRNKGSYHEKVRLIAERRLELSHVPTRDISKFLPADPWEQGLLEEIKRNICLEWESAGRPGRQGDFAHRYSVPRLFQRLKQAKKRKSYAGFQTLVDLSSGVVRDFLEPCYLMFDECVSKGSASTAITEIPVSVQNDVIYKYSEEFLITKFDDIRQDLPPERWTDLESLRNLIASLGRLFYERLHDPLAREARVFSFTIRGQAPEDLMGVLQLGVSYRYFQLRTYSSKEGGGREPWYILNRRLCPVYKLDPSGFEGRVSITPDLLKLACHDPERFVRARLRISDDPIEDGLFSAAKDAK